MARKEVKRWFTKSGSGIRPVYNLVIDVRTGAEELKETGKENYDDFIQSFAPSCDITVIAARVAAGEVELLNKRPGFFGDVSEMPQTLAEILQTRIDAKRIFDNLAPEVKEKFGSLDEFCENAGDFPWLEKLGVKFDTDKAVAAIEKEVMEDEQKQ